MLRGGSSAIPPRGIHLQEGESLLLAPACESKAADLFVGPERLCKPQNGGALHPVAVGMAGAEPEESPLGHVGVLSRGAPSCCNFISKSSHPLKQTSSGVGFLLPVHAACRDRATRLTGGMGCGVCLFNLQRCDASENCERAGAPWQGERRLNAPEDSGYGSVSFNAVCFTVHKSLHKKAPLAAS